MRRASRVVVVKDDALLVMHRNKFGQEYYTLIGGGIEENETPEQAAAREVSEETTLDINNLHQVFLEKAGEPFGDQYIFTADYVAGEISLPADSEEGVVHAGGENLYTPMWLPLKDLPNVNFKSEPLKQELLNGLAHGFPDEVKMIIPDKEDIK